MAAAAASKQNFLILIPRLAGVAGRDWRQVAQSSSVAAMRYFLDCEYNGFGGALLSLALVPEHGGEELYLIFDCADPVEPWVERHVMPYIGTVPEALKLPAMGREQSAQAIAMYFGHDFEPEIVADWPSDIELFCGVLSFAPGRMVAVPELRFRLVQTGSFSPAENSAVPHNALHDARALRDFVLGLE
jgi:hypothetical protein